MSCSSAFFRLLPPSSAFFHLLPPFTSLRLRRPSFSVCPSISQVDVEGCEFQVLQGVDEAHWPLINNVSLEVETFEDVQRVTALLEAKGFQVRSRASEREKVPEVTSEVSHVWARRNRKL